MLREIEERTRNGKDHIRLIIYSQDGEEKEAETYHRRRYGLVVQQVED